MPTSSINRVILIGNLTRDPELRALGDSGSSVCHLRIACNGRRRDKDGTWADRPHFFDVSVFGPHGVTSHRYLRKGKPVAIDGRLEWREWDGPDQHKRQSVSIVADTVQFLGAPDRRPQAGEGEAAADGQPAADGADAGTGADGGAQSEAGPGTTPRSGAGELEPVGAGAPGGTDDSGDLRF